MTNQGMSPPEIISASGIPKGTVYGILSSMGKTPDADSTPTTNKHRQLNELFDLSTEELTRRLKGKDLVRSHSSALLLSVMEKTHDRLFKGQTTPATNFISQLFDSVKDQMVSITIGPPRQPDPPIQVVNASPLSASSGDPKPCLDEGKPEEGTAPQ